MGSRGRALVSLGRISNLPTVWTNTLAALALVGGTPAWWQVVVAGLAMSFMYTGGMYLNDAFDREIDQKERPERPIPSGVFSARSVFLMGFAQLIVGVISVGTLERVAQTTGNGAATLVSLILAAFILAYDVHHKGNPFSPLLMGMCRVSVYFTVGLLFLPSASAFPEMLTSPGLQYLSGGALLLLVYLMVLTFVAKREGRGITPPLPISTLIAGICLIDGAMMLAMGRYWLAPCAVLGFWATLRLQRWVRGT